MFTIDNSIDTERKYVDLASTVSSNLITSKN